VFLVNTTTTRALVALFGMDPADYLDQWIQLVPATADSGTPTILVKRGTPLSTEAVSAKPEAADSRPETTIEPGSSIKPA
jgi:hypothetical protein